MQILHDAASIQAAIRSPPDEPIGRLLAARVQYLSENDDGDLGELLNVVLIEPGDTLLAIDAQMDGALLANPFSGRRLGDPGFEPAFETLEEHASFFEMFFIRGEVLGVAVIVPKGEGIDAGRPCLPTPWPFWETTCASTTKSVPASASTTAACLGCSRQHRGSPASGGCRPNCDLGWRLSTEARWGPASTGPPESHFRRAPSSHVSRPQPAA